MTLDFFYKNYKLEDINIHKLFIKDNKLHLAFGAVAYLELIANGYRPEMDVEYNNEFIFDVNHSDIEYKNDDLIDILYDGNLVFKLKNEDIIITNNEIKVK